MFGVGRSMLDVPLVHGEGRVRGAVQFGVVIVKRVTDKSRAGSEALLTDLDPVHVIGFKFRPDRLSFQLSSASLANHRQVVYRRARIQLHEAELAALAF